MSIYQINLVRSLSILLLAMTGCADSSVNESNVAEPLQHPRRSTLSSFRASSGMTGRTVLSCPAGNCIVLHQPLELINLAEDLKEYYQDLTRTLLGDPNSPDDDGEILSIGEDDHWCTENVLGGGMLTYNCCTYAVGDVVGLSDSDWISPTALDATEYTVPMTILLESYFEMVHHETGAEIDWPSLESHPNFEQGDVFCFIYRRGGQQEYAHVGKIMPRDGRNWLFSKLGRGQIVRASLTSTAKLFQGEFEQIRVYRRKIKSI